MLTKQQEAGVIAEIYFQTSLSGGKGGQNVNKVATKVELYFNIKDSVILNGEQKELLFEKQKNKISEESILKLVAQSERTQLGNKNVVVKKFIKLLHKTFEIKKKRIATKTPQKEKEKRLRQKKKRALVIGNRKINSES